MAKQTVELVDEINRCRHVVGILSRESVLAVDCEGIALGVEGPLTLLQVCTYSGEVYLFDIQENWELFSKGELKTVLESDEILKVIHACSYDSGALYRQFQVTLRNVFDTQVADTVLEEHQGRLLVKSLNLQKLCEKYSTHKKVSEYKEELRAQYSKREGSFWAKRPLTDEMMSVAEGDVRALIPEVFETQKRLIEENGLVEIFRERVSETINFFMDIRVRTLRYERKNKTMNQIIDSINETYDEDTKFSAFPDDSDEFEALKRIDFREASKKSSFIDRLKTESIMSDLEELDDKIASGEDYQVKWIPFSCLTSISHHPNERVSNRAKIVRQLLKEKILREIEGKYTIETNLTHLTKCEMDVLRSLNLNSYFDQQLPEQTRRLYWLLTKDDIDRNCTKLKEYGEEFKMKKWYYNKINYYLKTWADVPDSLKRSAEIFKEQLDETFGRDVVPPPFK